MAKVDTVGDNYYKPLEYAESFGGCLFWGGCILSVLALLTDKVAHPTTYDVLQVAFIIFAFLFFILGLMQRLYLFPRAEDKRKQELLSNSFGVALTHEETVGYYNNDQTNPFKRLAASVMESSFFTNAIVRRMLRMQRATTVAYVVVYLIAALNRSSNLEFLAIAAQALFSEEIIARWLRMEWLRFRSEQVFDNLNRLFTNKKPFTKPLAQAQAIDFFSAYETAKTTAAISLSSKLFHEHNIALTEEWDRIRGRLGI
ncbi:hypothetical protein [Rhizobium rhizogenes]|uniref:Uncharacterized protein n=1 Tax=Rhizobium rhizogenes NBRC 13257 TaxID=1220581 RepID=A0AA87Q6S1_RHIRH|nr:hypothetical protein [Rhizobium rhizogenes]NTG71501.1 hypothetical protein [Rhizobium rhizogenes]NTG90597.1 hypothetical protein [Rhizobium rhizogenes]TRB03419.1 hypothetical protein EXN67_29320 [Rhizobium rhizogenes]TRB38161.1 hypothetical protein EXN73_28885 [Rhizobium rhizogenes]TRB53172.1 hypothetical protein EXN71_28870 [Rhizobium rhizogenes]